MQDNSLSVDSLYKKETSLKAVQTDYATKLMSYVSERVGKKLTPTETYQLCMEMLNSDPFIHFMMKSLEKLTNEQEHVSEIIKAYQANSKQKASTFIN